MAEAASGMPAWISRRDAAERVDVHVNTIRSWEKSRRLRRRTGRVGNQEIVEVNVADLERIAETRSGSRVGKAWALSPERMWGMYQEAAIEAQSARERAARAEAEASVLRQQLAREQELRGVETAAYMDQLGKIAKARARPPEEPAEGVTASDGDNL